VAPQAETGAINGSPGAPYTVKRLEELERAFGGAFVRVRAELGISAFGVQVVELPPSSGELSKSSGRIRATPGEAGDDDRHCAEPGTPPG
jgi:hypothetical protein